MSENKKREPKRIKLPPLVDRSNEYDILSCGSDEKIPQPYWKTLVPDENNYQNNSQGIQPLESDSAD